MKTAIVCCATLMLLPWLGAPAEAQAAPADPAASLVFQEGLRLERKGDLEKALKEYRQVADRFPGSPFAPRALLRLGKGLFRQGKDSEAEEVASRLIESYARTRHAADGHILKAEILIASSKGRADMEEARADLRRVSRLYSRTVYPLLPARAQARVRDGEISYLLGELPLASAAFVQAIEDEVRSEWTIRAQLGLAKVLLAQGDWHAAADQLQRIEPASGTAERFDAETTAEARRLLTLIHRLELRPASGQKSWKSARRIAGAGKKPVAVAASDDGTLAIVDQGSDALLRLTADGKVERPAAVKEPARPWWHGEDLYLAAANRLLILPARTSDSSRSRTPGAPFSIPRGDKKEPVKDLVGGARGIFGQFFLRQRSPAQVLAFQADRKYIGSIFGDAPIDLTADDRGNLYILSDKTQQVHRFSPEGAPKGAPIRGLGRKPVALDVDALGRVYVLDRDRGDQTVRIRIFDSGGKLKDTLDPKLPGGIALRAPQDIAVDGSGRLYIADPKVGVVVLE